MSSHVDTELREIDSGSVEDRTSSITLCDVCTRQLRGVDLNGNAQYPFNCCFCFGILDDQYVNQVVEQVKKLHGDSGYDAQSFLLSINIPVTAVLRESIYELAYRSSSSSGTLSTVPLRMRILNSFLTKIYNATGLRPSVKSDLTIMLTFKNDEFHESDVNYLMAKFPKDFEQSRKRRFENVPTNQLLTKVRISSMTSRLDHQYALKYKMISPTKSCECEIKFERESVYIAGRYCKYSRTLSQSPWSSSEEVPKVPGNSVSEKIGNILIKETKCDTTRFVADGREDIDVRMLGEGRPFVIQLMNPRKIACFQKKHLQKTLERLRNEINMDKNINMSCELKLVLADQTNMLKDNSDEKRKCYTAYCWSEIGLDENVLDSIRAKAPICIVQKTPVRVLKRRPLLERERTIFSIDALRVNDHHFLIRLETQAGTYVKEFIHGDFGRTRPSLGDLLGIKSGTLDIIELDVERVDVDWPPNDDNPISISDNSILESIS